MLIPTGPRPDEGAVHDIPQDSDEDGPEEIRKPVHRLPGAAAPPAAAGQVGPPLLALAREDDAVLDAAAAPEHVGVVGRGVALAGDVGGAELELGGQLGGAGPLYVLGAVAGAAVVAAHDVDVVQGAEGLRGGASQLRGGGGPAVGGVAACAEGYGFDLFWGGRGRVVVSYGVVGGGLVMRVVGVGVRTSESRIASRGGLASAERARRARVVERGLRGRMVRGLSARRCGGCG